MNELSHKEIETLYKKIQEYIEFLNNQKEKIDVEQ